VQDSVAGYLDLHPVCKDRWCHPDGASRRDERHQYWAKRLGLKAGLPDVLVFSPCFVEGKAWGGLAMELKRCHGGSLTKPQRHWLGVFDQLGWYAVVVRGAQAARELIDLAYPFDVPHEMAPPGADLDTRLQLARDLVAIERADGSRMSRGEIAARCRIDKRCIPRPP
jgi:hypothetical protein